MLESEAQRRRAAEGGGFAASIERILNAHVRTPGDDVVVARARVEDVARAIGSELDARLLLKDLVLGVHRPCTGKSVEVANSGMLVALHHPPGGGWRLLAAIDSSASIHNRHPEVCFWALTLRAVCRFAFVTQDRNIYSLGRSELGRSCEQASSARKLLETFTDGVYLSKRYTSPSDPDLVRDIAAFSPAADAPPVFDAPDLDGHTRYCNRVRPLDDLARDLLRWRHEQRPRVEFRGTLPSDVAELFATSRRQRRQVRTQPPPVS